MDGRVVVGGITFVAAAIAFLPGLPISSLFVALPFFPIAAGFVAAPSAPLAAARLDVVPSRLWGRAEAVRTFARNLLQGFAPLLFGYVSSLSGAPTQLAPPLNNSPPGTGRRWQGLEYTFIIMLAPLLAAGDPVIHPEDVPRRRGHGGRVRADRARVRLRRAAHKTVPKISG